MIDGKTYNWSKLHKNVVGKNKTSTYDLICYSKQKYL